MKQEEIYKVKERKYGRRTRYVFTSVGKRKIDKLVEYLYLNRMNGYPVFNFGFGDYNAGIDEITDDRLSDNGDVYKVFYTVLSTVPLFFESNKNAIIKVRGSDSLPSYAENCRLTCKKKCTNLCKNAHRRISIYSGYVNKNFKELTEQFVFNGSNEEVEGQEVIEQYNVAKKYTTIYLMEKNN